jgi:glycosyltransferase involved in cell wall biosynthesis
VGSGFRPWRKGGLVAYVEDLMVEQVRRGHGVGYFFSGRQYPLLRGPRLRRWDASGVAMFEVVNSPLYDHGRQPVSELSEPRVEGMLEQALRDFQPEAVHVQELAGLPSSVIDVARRHGVPSVVTLQDYHLLCPMFKLLDADGQVCLKRQVGADCVRTAAADNRDPGLLVTATVGYQLARLPLVKRGDSARRDRWVGRIAHRVGHAEGIRRTRRAALDADADSYQLRRDLNVERLNRADRVIAMSSRVAEIHEQLGVDARRLCTVQLTLRHIEALRPRTFRPQGPVTFATLAGLESVPKGARVMIEAMRRLSDSASAGRCRLIVLGSIDHAFAEQARGLAGVELRGAYRPSQLDAILDAVDVGVVPSVWEEAYGYAGMELLAKGIPVIANAIGGMVDYVRPGETGWLNRSCTAAELARIMQDIVERPQQIASLNGHIRAHRESIVKPMVKHADEMDAIYAEAITRARGSSQALERGAPAQAL